MTTALLHRGSRFGDLRLTGYVGSGGFSDVYEAFDRSGRRLAIKVLRLTGLDPQGQQQRIERERETLSRVDSRGVAKLLHSDLECDTPWIASEFIDGPTLHEIVERDGPLGLDEGLSLVRRLAEILTELHEEGIAHRDLSPNNIIIGPDGPVIIDFGSARIDLEGSATGSLLLAGTTGYVPPEALRGEPVGKAGDTYSLARIALFAMNLNQEALPSVVTLCLQESPAERPNADVICAALSEFTTTISRNSKKEVVALKRRFGTLTVLGNAVVASALTLVVALAVAQEPGPISTESLISFRFSTNGQKYSNGVFELAALPSSWEVNRMRPIDSVFNYRPGDIDALEFRHRQDENQKAPVGPYGQVKASYFSLPITSASTSDSEVPLFGELPIFADQAIDQFESALLPDGCSLQRAETAKVLRGGRLLWAATTNDCASEPGTTFAAGLAIDIEESVVFSWFFAGPHDSNWEAIANGLSARKGFLVDAPIIKQSLSQITGLEDFSSALGVGPSNIDHAIGLIRVKAHQSIEIANGPNSEPQVSLYFIDVADDSLNSSHIPAGRWWAREQGESLVVTNPFGHEAILAIEAESIFDDTEIDLVVSQSLKEAQISSLRDALGPEFVPLITSEDGSTDAPLLVPLRLKDSLPAATDTIPFFVGNADLSASSEMAGASIGDTSLTFASRADDTKFAFELSYFEAHNPHWLISYAPAFELVIGREASDWVRVFEPDDCGQAVTWQKELQGSRLVIEGFLDCSVFDIYKYWTSSTVPQTNAVFRFALLEAGTESAVIVGSFAPSSRDELFRFRSWVEDLAANSEEAINFYLSS